MGLKTRIIRVSGHAVESEELKNLNDALETKAQKIEETKLRLKVGINIVLVGRVCLLSGRSGEDISQLCILLCLDDT